MKQKICNQFFVKDIIRDKKYIGTLKCVCCNEESNMSGQYGIPVDDFLKFIKAFINLHKMKGCNKEQLKHPEWASTEVGFGINV